MNNAVDAGNGSSADNVDAVVQIFQGVGNINIYKVALDAGQQIFRRFLSGGHIHGRCPRSVGRAGKDCGNRFR